MGTPALSCEPVDRPRSSVQAKLLGSEREVTPVELLASDFETYHAQVYKYLVNRLFDSELADELTAQTFYTAASRPAYALRDPARLRAWLLRVATNLANTHHRIRRRRELFLTRRAREAAAAQRVTPGNMEREDNRIRRLRAIVATLRPKYQAVVSLRYYNRLSHQEIGEILGCRTDAVRTRLSRALKEIRERLLVD